MAKYVEQPDNPMRIILTLTSLAALTFITACDSKQEEVRKDAIENKADAMENQADAVRKDAKTDAKADKASGEATADAIEKKAETVRDQK